MSRKQIKLSVSPDLFKELTKRAKAEKLPLSTYIRIKLLNMSEVPEAGAKESEAREADSLELESTSLDAKIEPGVVDLTDTSADESLIFLSDILNPKSAAVDSKDALIEDLTNAININAAEENSLKSTDKRTNKSVDANTTNLSAGKSQPFTVNINFNITRD